MYNGKAIYNPSGKAGEYSYWAANFYNGCSARCEYCYNRKGRAAKVLGGDVPTLKKCLVNFSTAQSIFRKEVDANLNELQKHGLFFNFVSDPCLKDTWLLNSYCMRYCIIYNIPVKILTKQTWWVDSFISEFIVNGTIWNTVNTQKYFAFGFTLTGHDELEPGAATNLERIEAMKKLHNVGFKTWASIEPIIDFKSSWNVIYKSLGYCNLYKIGLQSGKKYDPTIIRQFINQVLMFISFDKIYFKDSLLKQAGITRESLPSNCVNRYFNL